jgi:hypothetical protein
MRIADLEARQDRVRLDRVAGLGPGSELTFTQAAIVESATVRDVDGATGAITLQQGLEHSFPMRATDPPVTVRYSVAGATIEALQSGLRTTSREDGRYTFVRIPHGIETLRATAVGFQPLSASGIQIPQAGNQNYDVVLTPI